MPCQMATRYYNRANPLTKKKKSTTLTHLVPGTQNNFSLSIENILFSETLQYDQELSRAFREIARILVFVFSALHSAQNSLRTFGFSLTLRSTVACQ